MNWEARSYFCGKKFYIKPYEKVDVWERISGQAKHDSTTCEGRTGSGFKEQDQTSRMVPIFLPCMSYEQELEIFDELEESTRGIIGHSTRYKAPLYDLGCATCVDQQADEQAVARN